MLVMVDLCFQAYVVGIPVLPSPFLLKASLMLLALEQLEGSHLAIDVFVDPQHVGTSSLVRTEQSRADSSLWSHEDVKVWG